MQSRTERKVARGTQRFSVESPYTSFIVSFFFQAEDGIRDGHVTGVQTCALPISRGERGGKTLAKSGSDIRRASSRSGQPDQHHAESGQHTFKPTQIGRASCRERE